MPEQSQGGFKALVCRGVKGGLLKRICHGLYLYPEVALAMKDMQATKRSADLIDWNVANELV